MEVVAVAMMGNVHITCLVVLFGLFAMDAIADGGVLWSEKIMGCRCGCVEPSSGSTGEFLGFASPTERRWLGEERKWEKSRRRQGVANRARREGR